MFTKDLIWRELTLSGGSSKAPDRISRTGEGVSYDTYTIVAKILLEKFEGTTGRYPKQLLFHKSKSPG